MAIKIWRGDEQATRHRVVVTVDNPESGDVFTVTINRKDVSFTCDSDSALTDAGASEAELIQNVLQGLATAIGTYNNSIPEWAECSATVDTDDTTGLVNALWIYGPTDGAPITVTGSSTDSGSQGVTITVLQNGAAGVNEKQVVTLPGPPTSGTFTLTFEGYTTGAIAYNASAATVETAFEALTSVGAGNGTVSGDAGGPWTIEFTGSLAATDVSLVTADGSSLDGGQDYSAEEDTTGGVQNHIFDLSRDTSLTEAPNVHHFDVVIKTAVGTYVGTFYLTDTVSGLQATLDAAFGANQITVRAPTRTAGSNEVILWEFEWIGASVGTWTPSGSTITARKHIRVSAVYDSTGTFLSDVDELVEENEVQDGTAVNEIQILSILHGPTGGTFTLTFEGQTTSALTYDESAADLETALEALSNCDGVAVTGDDGGPWTIEFDGSLVSKRDVALLTADLTNLTGHTPTVSVTQTAVAQTNEKQLVTISNNTTGGTFVLTWDPGGGDESTANIAYDATASAVQSALIALATPVAGDIVVSGNAGGPWTLEFANNYAGTDVNTVVGDGTGLTGVGSQTITVTDDGTGDSVSPTGPNWWSHADNWQDTSTSTASAPTNGDVVVFENNAVDCLYGLDELSAITLLELHVRASYSGKLGLATHTGDYFQYRPTAAEVGATSVWIGEGEGAGSPLIRLDLGSVQSAIEVWNTGTPEDEQPAFQFQGTHVSNVLRVYRGSVGVGTEQWEDASALASMVVAYVESEESDALVYIGPNVTTLGSVDQTGGTVNLDGDSTLTVTTWTLEAGAVVFGGEAAVTTFRARNGEVVYNSSGTCSTMDIGPTGIVQLNQDQRSRTFTDTIMAAGATLLDPGSTVTFTNGIDLDNCSIPEVTLDVGRNVTLTPSAASVSH